jgi:hypothetical protein
MIRCRKQRQTEIVVKIIEVKFYEFNYFRKLLLKKKKKTIPSYHDVNSLSRDLALYMQKSEFKLDCPFIHLRGEFLVTRTEKKTTSHGKNNYLHKQCE